MVPRLHRVPSISYVRGKFSDSHTKAVRAEPEVDPITSYSLCRPSRGGSCEGGTPQAHRHGGLGPGGRGRARHRRSRARTTTCGLTRRGGRTAGPKPALKSKSVNLKVKHPDESEDEKRTERAVETTCSLSSTTTWMRGWASSTSTDCEPMPPPTSTSTEPCGRSSHENPIHRVNTSLLASYWRVPTIACPNHRNLLSFPGSSNQEKSPSCTLNATLNGAT